LGTAALGRLLGQRLQSLTHALPVDDPRRVTDYHIFVLELACLLHDLGHGPLSHQFDAYLKEEQMTALRELPNHEARGVRLACFVLEDCWCQSAAWRLLFPEGIYELHSHVRALILGQHSATLPACLAETVHAADESTLDLDRLDYLPRDAAVLLDSSSHWTYLAGRAINQARLTPDMTRLEFEPLAERKLLLLRLQLTEQFYVHTSHHRAIVTSAMRRMITPEMLQLLYLRTRDDANAYLRLFKEDRLLALCLEEGLTMRSSV
jgi:HD superfamily phosphohydrolase